ncbi:MAG: cell division protein FtsA [Kiritimatiellae bacterium]|nr:cell division protein FtsA [Kiritimatiellia bacterium]
MTKAPFAALEIGTSKVCALVGEPREDGNIMITGMGNCLSCGVRKGIIVDLEKAAACVQTAVQEAETTGAVEIRQIYLIVNGEHIRGSDNQGSVPVFDSVRGISADDIDDVTDIARTINLPHENESLHTIPQTYAADGQNGIINPLGMHSSRLSLNMLIVHGSRNILNNTIQAARNVGLEVMDIAFSGLCSALATLTPEQKECGVALIDIGGGTTNYVVYAENAIAAVGVIAVGGDHVTNDIAQGFTISIRRAEALKQESGAAVVAPSDRSRHITIPLEVGFPACSVTAGDLNAIINARMDETFQIIRNELERKALLPELGAGLILTGGASRLKGTEALAEKVFGVSCVTGRPRRFSGISSAHDGPEYAAPLGMIRYAIRGAVRQAEETLSLGGLIKRWFAGQA